MEELGLIRFLQENVLAKADLTYYSLVEEKSVYRLSVLLFTYTRRRVNPRALQLFFQQNTNTINVSRFVLDTLALYAGSTIWEDFCTQKRLEYNKNTGL